MFSIITPWNDLMAQYGQKKANVVPSTKKMISKSYPIIDLFPSFQFVARYLNVIQCTNI